MVVIFIIMKHFITFISTMALLLLLAMPAFSQEITVRFIGQINGTDYCRLDRVAVINVTRNWTEMVEYPDTIIVLGSTVGANLNIAAEQGLGQNIPNPFDCETRVELSLSQSDDVRMQLLDVVGKVYAEYNASLDAGVHTFDISAANPQTYLLNATVGNRQYSIRMVNVGSGCGCSIKYAGVSGGIEAKLTSTNEFLIGDNMRYVGYTTIDGESVASAIVEQMQVISQTITLNFTHYSQPRVETLSATNITATGATLKGNVTSNGGATVTVRGFMYGTSASNLSQNVQSGSGTGNYTKALTGLSSGTTYYYKAYATNSIGTAYGDVMSFTTQTIYPPSVQTNSASNITTTGATLSGNVTSDGNATVTARGFMYGTSANNLSQTVQNGSGTGSFTKTLTGLSASTTYYYKAYATNTAGTAYGDVMSFTTEASTGTVNGHAWVDLGLPSGTRWATCNVGASTPTAYGNYYAWGETTPKDEYTWSTYQHANGSENTLTKYCNDAEYGDGGFVDNLTTLELEDDAASANWGSGWRIPTSAEMQELFDYCTHTWTTQSGVNGRLITGLNGNSIFLPAAGYSYGSEFYNAGYHGFYWSSSLDSGLTRYARYLDFYSGSYSMNYSRRCYGLAVRPVCVSTTTTTVPFVTTSAATNITSTTATLNGNVTFDGNATVTARGFLYGTDANNLTQSVQSGSGTGSFTKTLTGLSSSTTYYYKAYATNTAGTAYGEVRSFTTENSGATTTSIPSVTTSAATNITSTSATLNGIVTNDGGATVTERGFIYGDGSIYEGSVVSYASLESLVGCSTVQCGSGTGSFTANITDYYEGSTVFYKAYATNSEGTAYGEVMWFTMENNASLPTVVTNYATNVTPTGGILNGNVTSDGGATVTERGFIYIGRSFLGNLSESLVGSASLEVLYNCSTVQCGSGTGSFTANITDCEDGIPVYYKAYATNSVGTAYGEVMSFTTENNANASLPTVVTNNATNVSSTGATLSGYVSFDGGATITECGFMYGTSANNLSQTVQSDSGPDSFTKAITGLSSETAYYYKAYATNTAGTAYGEVVSFTTLTPTLPTVVTNGAYDITPTRAILYGDVSSNGNTTVTARGFVYGTSANNLTQSVQSGSGTGSYNKSITGLSSGYTYYYKAYATNSEGTCYGDVNSFTCPTWVDLGLPSGTRWATCNVGASTPTGYGSYYAWGETTTKSSYTYENYTYSSNPETLPMSADAANANWGSGWRMPKSTEMQELVNNCTVTWTNQSGVRGRLFTGPNGNSIFLPAAGYRVGNLCYDNGSRGLYRSSSHYDDDDSYNAMYLAIREDDCSINSIDRFWGLSVRPVYVSTSYVASPPVVITDFNSNITGNSVKLSGNVISNGNATVTARGFVYGTSANNLTQSVLSGSGNGSYTKTLTGLSSSTTYYYKAYATNSEGTAYGAVKSFTTMEIYLPTVTTISSTSITTTGATVKGNVASDGNGTVSSRGFMYGTDANNLTLSVQSGNGTGNYTINLTELASGTTYYYKAFATNDAGTSYGEVMNFTTIAVYPPTVTTGSVSNITVTGATISGNVTFDGNATITSRGFMYGTDADNLTQTVQSGSGTGSFTKVLTGLSVGTTYYYKAYATNSAGTSYGDVKSFTIPITTGNVNGHAWVDLGLPSGTKWATCNIGATNPEDYGEYYAWGETTTKSTYYWSNYRYCNGSSRTLTKYCDVSSYGKNGFTDNLVTLVASDDAATANWGSEWRMPTETEMEELENNCTTTWTTRNGVRGRLFRGPNGNSIFLPAAGYRDGGSLSYDGSRGYYWSSSLGTGFPSDGIALKFDSSYSSFVGCNRGVGQSIRPICVSHN